VSVLGDVFQWLLLFVGLYVVIAAGAWIASALRFAMTRETPDAEAFYDIPDDQLPSMTVLVPAYAEERTIGDALDALAAVDYPDLEVIAIDDGSPDGTARVIRDRLAHDPRLRLLEKRVNEGKAMAMNDAIAVSRGEIIVVIDADAQVAPGALRAIAAHFVRIPRVGGVTGNPRPVNLGTWLAEMQVVEFAAQVSLMRRAQVSWGRILTMSGVISSFRRSVLADVGLFDPTMDTEDIELTWRIQRRFYDVRYEPRAVVGMSVPITLRGLLRQRLRWGRGLIQVLLKHGGILFRWRNRRNWPVIIEAVISLLWWHVLVVVIVIGVALASVDIGGYEDITPFPWGWVAAVITIALVQLATGLMIDRRYDPSATAALGPMPWYPIGYWFVVGCTTLLSTIPTLLRPRSGPNVTWKVDREQE
jgi:biofilm PGA synthesis N-glycosyltransferase PgaC